MRTGTVGRDIGLAYPHGAGVPHLRDDRRVMIRDPVRRLR